MSETPDDLEPETAGVGSGAMGGDERYSYISFINDRRVVMDREERVIKFQYLADRQWRTPFILKPGEAIDLADAILAFWEVEP